ncbi:hypothetical protein EMPS_08598 [Entomortierella parvispora]|uniref:Uncharacterized protein n=1 Tax=Entomortierella parvispora TaxID=205924 RepID=A0A9P3LZF9_9FUNG|nr:hypothetical protein EMPS_08598 [Entomortierella parvispora]
MIVPDKPKHPFNRSSYWEQVTVYSYVFRSGQRAQTSFGDRDPIWDRPSSEIDMAKSVEATKDHFRTMTQTINDKRLFSVTTMPTTQGNVNPPLYILQDRLQSIQHLRLQLPCKSSFLVLFNHAGALPNLKTIEFHIQQTAPVLEGMDRLMDLATTFLGNQLRPTASATPSELLTPTILPGLKSLLLNDTKALDSGRQALVIPIFKYLATALGPIPEDTVAREEITSSIPQSDDTDTDQISHTGPVNLEIRNFNLESQDQRLFWETCARIPGRLGLFGCSNLVGRIRSCPDDVYLSHLTELEMTELSNITSSQQVVILKKCPNLKTLIWRAYSVKKARQKIVPYVYGAGPQLEPALLPKKNPNSESSANIKLGTKKNIKDPLWSESDEEHEKTEKLALTVETLVLDGDMFQERDCRMLIDSIEEHRLKKLQIINMTSHGFLDVGPLSGGNQFESLVDLDFSQCLMVTSPVVQHLLENCIRLEVIRAKELLVADVIEAVNWASEKNPVAPADAETTDTLAAVTLPLKRSADEMVEGDDAAESMESSRENWSGRQLKRRTGLWVCAQLKELSLEIVLGSRKEAKERKFIDKRLKLLSKLPYKSLKIVVREDLSLALPPATSPLVSEDVPKVARKKRALENTSTTDLKSSSSKTLSSKISSKRSSSKGPSTKGSTKKVSSTKGSTMKGSTTKGSTKKDLTTKGLTKKAVSTKPSPSESSPVKKKSFTSKYPSLIGSAKRIIQGVKKGTVAPLAKQYRKPKT